MLLSKTSSLFSKLKNSFLFNIDLKPGESYEFSIDAGKYYEIDYVYADMGIVSFSVQNQKEFFYESTLGILGIIFSIISFIEFPSK